MELGRPGGINNPGEQMSPFKLPGLFPPPLGDLAPCRVFRAGIRKTPGSVAWLLRLFCYYLREVVGLQTQTGMETPVGLHHWVYPYGYSCDLAS